jgi:hypothetical protein
VETGIKKTENTDGELHNASLEIVTTDRASHRRQFRLNEGGKQ